MIRRLIAAFAAALLVFAPIAASAQTISYSPNSLPLSGSCGTVAVSTPCLNLTQTWNAVGVTFTGLLFNATDTNSASGSLLMDLQVASSSKLNVQKDGTTTSTGSFIAGANFSAALNIIGNQNTSTFKLGSSQDVILARDAANTLALRNGVNGQSFNIYNTYTDASNYERGVFDWSTNVGSLTIGTAKAGTGASRQIQFQVGGSPVFFVNTSGHTLYNTDNAFDIGASGANRPRNLFIASALTVGSNTTSGNFFAGTGATNGYYVTGRSGLLSGADGNWALVNNAGTSFGLLQFGGTTSSFPAWKRNAAGLDARVADDTAYAFVTMAQTRTPPVAVSALPACSGSTTGTRAFVSDSTVGASGNFGAAVAGGAGGTVPVFCDGTSWKIG